MSLWRFLDYCTDDHPPKNLIQIWYGQQSPVVQAEFDVTVNVLRATQDWRTTKQFKQLKRNHDGLGELRFAVRQERHGKVILRRFRPVGILREERSEFVFLIGCEKAHGIYEPPNAFDLAMDLKLKLEQGRGSTREHY